METKVSWAGMVASVQPRIRMTRSFDERSHSYQGYLLRLEGIVDGESRLFTVAIGEAAQRQQQLKRGDEVSGVSLPVADSRLEAAEYYKASRLKVERRAEETPCSPPPWYGMPPELTVYRERGHRRLDARTYETKCQACLWGCRMPVEIIVDHWKPNVRRYRFETFCYGPKSCALYRAGPTRKVPGRNGMSYEEQDWIDEQATAHRGEDE